MVDWVSEVAVADAEHASSDRSARIGRIGGRARRADRADDHVGALADEIVDHAVDRAVGRLVGPHAGDGPAEHTAGGVDLVDGEGQPAFLPDGRAR